MNEAAKKRMIGAVVLVLLMIIFVPMLFDEEPTRTDPVPVAESDPPESPRSEPPAEVFLPSGSSAPEELTLDEEELVPLDQLDADGDWGSETTASTVPPGAGEAASERQAEGPSEPAPESQSEPAPVRAPLEAQTAVTDGAYVVQIAALSTPERADRLVQELEGKGFAPFIERAEVGGKIYYRVRVGPRGDRAAAEELAASLRRATPHRGQVLRVQ